ncbi:MAG: hypothetical protein K2Y22_13770 [Candidatus Obscuribacterales bacterium]|nr:hypothetical protein [Candidatus Obscuribacterales bacterium]
MSRSILILAPDKDVHTRAVCDELDKLKCKVVVWSARRIPQESLLGFELGGNECASLVSQDSQTFELGAFDAIWYRRPGTPKSGSMPKRWLEALVNWESGRALEGIYRTLSHAFWVNNPTKQQEALIKLNQLKIAQDAGFKIPHTLVSNDPKLIKQFAERFSNRIIYKLIDEASWQYFPEQEQPRGMPTLEFRETDLSHLEQTKYSLQLFQEKIEKICDLRVMVVGDEIFAVKIEPQVEGAKLDWRVARNNKLSKFKLPDDIESKCRQLMKNLGLVYAAFDFALTPDGRFVFFELNPQGQFLWLQEALELPIAQRLAGLLVEGK